MEPSIEAVRPQTGRELSDLHRIFEAIVWRMQNGAKRRAIPAGLGPWWMAAQTVLRWFSSAFGSAYYFGLRCLSQHFSEREAERDLEIKPLATGQKGSN
jgi:hypothetical protein